MTVMETGISWCDSTWNPTVGCVKVSAGCDNCYAEAQVNRFGGDFSKLVLHPKRLADVAKFKPVPLYGNPAVTGKPENAGPDWRPLIGMRPRLVFVNSMSDLFHHELVEDHHDFLDQVFDRIDEHHGRQRPLPEQRIDGEPPDAIFQILTKRPVSAADYLKQRYRQLPDNIWIGASVESNLVQARLRILRRLKDKIGGTFFASVEPLIDAINEADFTGFDWVIIGGESGPKARPMLLDWVYQARDSARKAGAAVWFKQWGTWNNNPLYDRTLTAGRYGHLGAVKIAIERGERCAWIDLEWDRRLGGNRQVVKGEKGGATLDGEVIRELPKAYPAGARP